MLVDTHCHLFSSYYKDLDDVIDRAIDNDVRAVIVNGVDRDSNEEVLRLVKKYDIVYGALGIQPEEVEKCCEDDLLFIEEHINDDKIVAVGEIGLDYHYECNKELQKEIFKRQLEIASKYNKPVIVHSRDCINETYNILKEHNVKGILHCYSGSVEMAKLFNKIGFLLGIGGIVTFKNAVKLVEVVKNVDMEYLVVETDCPYLTPEPFRGKRNEPKNVDLIIQKIADIKGVDVAFVKSSVRANVLRLFDKEMHL